MRLRLILSYVLVVLVSVASVVIAARLSAANEVGRFMLSGGMASANELALALEDYYQANGSLQGAESLLSLEAMGHSSGQGPGQGLGPGMMSMMNQPLLLADAEGIILYDSQEPLRSGILTSSDLAQAIPLHSGLLTIGYFLVEGENPLARADSRGLINRLSTAAQVAGLIGGSLALLMGFLLAYQLIRPVQELTRLAHLWAQGDLTHRAQVRGNDELATLARTFNHMAESLQQAEESRRAMTADIAHELRNPLAVQRASLEALQDGLYPPTPESLAPVLEQNQLLTRLVDDLRTLALADAGQLSLERLPSDFPTLVSRLLERFRPQAASHNLNLQFISPAKPLPLVSIDAARIEQIVGNLLSNALRFTPSGGTVQLTVSGSTSHIELTVHDSGPGIPVDALQHIFERFYRADKSRSRAEGGTGLGLAIARQLALAHGGSLTAANNPQGGAVFTLILPYHFGQ